MDYLFWELVKKNKIHKINTLTVIIPFYNEQNRLNISFSNIDNLIKKNFFKKIEIIFVNDGSNDISLKIIKNFTKIINKKKNKNLSIKCINLIKNQGKGRAIKIGFLKAKYDWVLTSDVDFSVPISSLFKWIDRGYLKKNLYIYFGSRNLKNSRVKTTLLRLCTGKIFQFLIMLFLKIRFKDTQCGFKLYKKNNAKIIFMNLNRKGFDHDLEIVLLAKKNNLMIKELPVFWHHVDQSKLNIIKDSLKMFFGIFVLSLKYVKEL